MTESVGAQIRNRGYATLILRAGGMALLFLMHTTLARHIGSENYGSFSFALILGAVLAKLTSLGWPNALTRFVAEYREARRDDLVRGVIRRAHQTTLSVSLVASLLLAASAFWLPLRSDLQGGLLFTALLTPLVAMVSVRRGTFQGLHRPYASVVPDEVLLPGIVILFCLLFDIQHDSEAVFSYAAANLTVFFLATIWLVRSVRPGKAKNITYKTRDWLDSALPMALGGLGFLLLNRTDSIMLGLLSDMQSVGLYSAANRYAILISVVFGSISIVVVPMLSAAYHGGRRSAFHSLLRSARQWSILGALPLVAAMQLFPGFLLGLFGVEFRAGTDVLRILALGHFISVIIGPVGQGLMMAGYQRITAWSTLFVALGNIAANALVIPRYGAEGAAWTTIVSISTLNLILWRILCWRIPQEEMSPT